PRGGPPRDRSRAPPARTPARGRAPSAVRPLAGGPAPGPAQPTLRPTAARPRTTTILAPAIPRRCGKASGVPPPEPPPNRARRGGAAIRRYEQRPRRRARVT